MRTFIARTSGETAGKRIAQVPRALAAAALIVAITSFDAAGGDSATASREAKPAAAKAADPKDRSVPHAKPEPKAPEPKAARPAESRSSESKAAESKLVVAAESHETALACLSQAMYWEAGIEGPEGMIAVGWVVLNGIQSKEFPGTVCGTVKQGRDKPGCQFSYWCDGKSDTPKQDANWALAQQMAREILTKPPPDPTGGAIFYHAVDVRVPWTTDRERTAKIGRHIFYR